MIIWSNIRYEDLINKLFEKLNEVSNLVEIQSFEHEYTPVDVTDDEDLKWCIFVHIQVASCVIGDQYVKEHELTLYH